MRTRIFVSVVGLFCLVSSAVLAQDDMELVGVADVAPTLCRRSIVDLPASTRR